MSSSMPVTTLPVWKGGCPAQGMGERHRRSEKNESWSELAVSWGECAQSPPGVWEAPPEGRWGEGHSPKRQLWQHRPQRHTSNASASVLPQSNNPLLHVLFIVRVGVCARACVRGECGGDEVVQSGGLALLTFACRRVSFFGAPLGVKARRKIKGIDHRALVELFYIGKNLEK